MIDVDNCVQEIKTQKEKIKNGVDKFNQVIIDNSIADNIYDAIKEWEFTYEIDVYNQTVDVDEIKILLDDYGKGDISKKLKINYSNEAGGNCICGKEKLKSVYWIINKHNKIKLPTGCSCITKTFQDGSLDDIKVINNVICKYKNSLNAQKKINQKHKIDAQKNKSVIKVLTEENYAKDMKISRLEKKINEYDNNSIIEIKEYYINRIKEIKDRSTKIIMAQQQHIKDLEKNNVCVPSDVIKRANDFNKAVSDYRYIINNVCKTIMTNEQFEKLNNNIQELREQNIIEY